MPLRGQPIGPKKQSLKPGVNKDPKANMAAGKGIRQASSGRLKAKAMRASGGMR